MHRCLLVITVVSMMTLMTHAQDQTQSEGSNQEIAKKNPVGYFLGVSMGQQLQQQGLTAEDFDTTALAAGIADALSRGDLGLSNEELQAAQTQLQSILTARHKELQAEMTKKAEQNKQKGAMWLEQNSKQDGVEELAGGMQYKVLKKGDGGSPSQSDKVRVHYTGKLINGDVFDSSVKRGEPAEFVVGGVIKGWQMALQKMKVGDKWMLYIPSDLAYGERGSPGAIGPNEVLIFEVELLEIL
ncbi:FKBP-type peptidyl-prolyl cis-trans isomerase [Stieleria sp. TO1_6]|uniref:FKBP-type peptidyl-prolyl cis-trans isomerase n=1 Tax=Stieleria tagensis TaxID=2956795 RepID=UPI00209A719D|nr:FKBP-type peptidyl-prolyl cis-trans isomerase [Stieleria tagensis]MCO8120388.1 FKBP-type peptidyl-prolyl cis-trans isomerase [Stieleria tagensis]